LPPATHTNSYALGGRDVVLVEPATPYEHERREWLEWARGFESRGRNLVAILLTHHHSDHIGGAEFFTRELGLPLWAHAETFARLPALSVDRVLEDGETVTLAGPAAQRWTALHTPGHAPGHVCLYEAALGVLIVGDMVASKGTILVAPDDGDMLEYLRQLSRLKNLGARLALPAHGDPIDDPALLFSRYVEHRLLRERKVLGALVGVPAGATPEGLLQIAYDDTPQAAFPLARLSLEAHLIKLVREGRATTDGERYFAAAN
jgi:glyoxylase-like metal-dependent hydrolase (beta-lactamase superfamily II)